MFIQSNDYIDFVSPIEIYQIISKGNFFHRYYLIVLREERMFKLTNQDKIKTDRLIIEQRFPFSILGIKKLPKEVMVLTPNYYDRKSTSVKSILALVDLYNGYPNHLE